MRRYLGVFSAALTIARPPSAAAWTLCCLAPTTTTLQCYGQHNVFTRLYMSSSTATSSGADFKFGDSVQVEVLSFGPLGASVDVVGLGHGEDNLIPETEPPLGEGLVLQKEIHYFRQARNNVDVVLGEVLPAYIEKVRDDGKLDICLRTPGGKAKADEVGKLILERLEWAPSGRLQIGDKSSPEIIGREFPGVSKGAFKKAVSALYKKGLVQPGPESIELMDKES